MMLPEVSALIEHYKIELLPVEKALFTSTYRSDREFGDGKPCGTVIIGLSCDEPRSVSHFHKLPVDEVWHFYGGDPLRLVLLYPDGSSRDVIMGNDPLTGHYVQFVVPAGVWKAGPMLNGGRYFTYRQGMDFSLLVTWVWLGVTIGAYFIYLVLDISGDLWERGIWFTENDVLQIGLIIWMLYIAVYVAKRITDQPNFVEARR
jgi:predicted cupin superfamily sugar epimerase